MKSPYLTIQKDDVIEYEEKKSIFIAHAFHVIDEETALEHLNQLRHKYWDATHNVYAYHIEGEDPNLQTLQKYSDDGEPSGTAGLPVLESLHRKNLTNVLVVVTRYFGGTMLGAAGLVRAYGKSASLALDSAGVITRTLCQEITVTLSYTLLGKIQNLLASKGFLIHNATYLQDPELSLFIPIEEIENLKSSLIDTTNANILISDGPISFKTIHTN